jgi:putative peptidoglycan lipid II flippase
MLAALLMGVVMWFANDLFRPYTTGPSLHRWGAMLVLVSAGALVYFAATFLFGAFRMADVRRLVRR